MRNSHVVALALTIAINFSAPVSGQSPAGPGFSETEIRIGHIGSYSGPLAVTGQIGDTLAAYFAMINDRGGVNGRRVRFITYDDAANPQRTVEQAHRLVERDDVLLLFQVVGPPQNFAIRSYLNDNGIPQLLVASAAEQIADPSNFPYTMPWNPSFRDEGLIYGQYIRTNFPGAKVGVLFQNSDFGRDLLAGISEGLGDISVVAAMSHELSDPTVDSQVIALRAAGVDVFVNGGSARFASLALRKSIEIGWHPTRFLTSIASSVGAVLAPVGLAESEGILVATYLKDPTDPQWGDDREMNEWRSFMDRYYPRGDRSSVYTVYAYSAASVLLHILEASGNDLSRQNIMRQATAIQDFEAPMLLPGIVVNTGPDDYSPLEQMQLTRFNGSSFVPFGDVINARD